VANRRVSRRRRGCHALFAHVAACATGIALFSWSADAAPVLDCATEAAALLKEEADLPRLEVASPADRPPYCITLDTIMTFAARVKAHAVRCPQSGHAPAAAEWDRTRTEYAKLFSQYRCKRTR
jgi:hypothetical protein